MSAGKIKIVCSHCGSDDVRRDAWAEWNVDTQEWELGTVFDQGHCENCGGEASLDEQPVDTDDGSGSITVHENSTDWGGE